MSREGIREVVICGIHVEEFHFGGIYDTSLSPRCLTDSIEFYSTFMTSYEFGRDIAAASVRDVAVFMLDAIAISEHNRAVVRVLVDLIKFGP